MRVMVPIYQTTRRFFGRGGSDLIAEVIERSLMPVAAAEWSDRAGRRVAVDAATDPTWVVEAPAGSRTFLAIDGPKLFTYPGGKMDVEDVFQAGLRGMFGFSIRRAGEPIEVEVTVKFDEGDDTTTMEHHDS